MISPSTIARGRAMSDSLMPDTCRITKAGVGQGPLNEETGEYDAPPRVTVYEGPFRSRGVNVMPGESTSAGQILIEQDAAIALPMNGSGAVTKNHILEWITSTFDPALVGVKVRIQGPSGRTSHSVARRFRIEEVA
jgi:hypothetical protein